LGQILLCEEDGHSDQGFTSYSIKCWSTTVFLSSS